MIWPYRAAHNPGNHRDYCEEPQNVAMGGAGCMLSHSCGVGTQNILCAYLSVAVLIGLVANACLGWWWADTHCDEITC